MRSVVVSYTRRTLTRAQAGDAAARNVQGLGSIHKVARLAVDLIHDAGNGKRALPPTIHAAMERRNVAIGKPLSGIAGSMPDGNPQAIRDYLLALASPTGNDDVLLWVVSDWLQDRLDAHADALDDLRSTHPDLYKALFAPTLHKAIRICKRTNIDRSRLASLLADQARFLLVGAAYDRIAHVQQMATSPYGQHFSGFNEWKFAGHVLLATVAEPALVVEQIYRHATTFNGDHDAARKELLPDNNAGAFVFQAALEAHAIMVHREVPPEHVQATLDRTSGPLARAARITSQDVADEGLARSSMTSLWFGLEPSELATYVAIELLKALGVVDALVEAALDGRTPVRTEKTLSDNQITFAATLLRAEGKSDRESLQLGRTRCGGRARSGQSGRS